MRGARSNSWVSELAGAAVWCCLGGALVIHGCAGTPTPTRRAQTPPTPTPPSGPTQPPRAEAPRVAEAPEPVNRFEDRPAVPTSEPDLRIRIAAFRSASAAPRLSHPSGALVLTVPGGATRTLRTPVEVRLEPGAWSVVEAAGTGRTRTFDVTTTGPIEFHPPEGARGVVSYDGQDWPGTVRAVPRVDGPGTLDLVVDVPLERYLPGVLAKELIKGWAPETFRAQAIAARSFAVCEHAHWQGIRHYDLVAGEASQAWIGEVKDQRPRDAVAQTRGMVLVFQDRVVPAYYSSTCGGTPANATDALTRNPYHGIAPLAAGASAAAAHRDCCANAPKFRWEQTIPVSTICAQLRRWSEDQLAAKTQRGRAPSQTAVASMGATSGAVPPTETGAGATPAAAPAAAPAATPAPSAAGVTEVADDAPLAALSTIRGIRSIEVTAVNAAGRPKQIRLVDSQGRTLLLRAEDFRRAVNYAREGERTPSLRLNSSAIATATVMGDAVRFSGAGFGHGVGMCQYGAESLARRGASAEQILRTYYPEATIRRAY
ncbi:MAG: SpoIID/LytB domain-containing protein [Phycisphaerales bacterium]